MLSKRLIACLFIIGFVFFLYLANNSLFVSYSGVRSEAAPDSVCFCKYDDSSRVCEDVLELFDSLAVDTLIRFLNKTEHVGYVNVFDREPHKIVFYSSGVVVNEVYLYGYDYVKSTNRPLIVRLRSKDDLLRWFVAHGVIVYD